MNKLNLTISRVLLVGLTVSMILLVAGVALTLARPGLPVVHQTSLRDMLGALARLEPAGFFDLGLLVLLATPAARVAALLVGFTRRRMWLFSAISLIVFAGLVAGVLLGLTG